MSSLQTNTHPIKQAIPFGRTNTNSTGSISKENFSAFKKFKVDEKVFADQNTFFTLRKNNKEDLFLLHYLFAELKKEDIKLPEGCNINVYAPYSIDRKTRNTLKHLIFGQFKGYTNYFFKLLSMPKEDFNKKVDELKLSTIIKDELKKVYDYLDNFYKVEFTINGSSKKYNLLNLSNKDKAELLRKASPEEKRAVEKIVQEADNLRAFARKFSRSEAERAALFEAGEGSRGFISKLVAGIAVLMGIEHYKPAMVNMLGPSTPVGRYFNNITEFVGGCGDDCLGSYKDYFQDEVTFGKDTARKIFGMSLVAGIASSAVVAPLPLNSWYGSILYGNASSGSSIFSNIATFLLMYKNYDKMVEKGIIEPPEKDLKGIRKFIHKNKVVWNNFAAYDAYYGKVVGILACTPAALIAYKTGAFGASSKFVKAAALTIVGSIESYITIIIQLLRDNVRKAKIKTSKEIVSKGDANPENYDSRRLNLDNVSKTSQTLGSIKNFFKTFKK